jgi:DNA-binding GntR family transcriptional regulator
MPARSISLVSSVVPALMRDDVYGQIRTEILACALKPGSLVQENDLALRYAVSKSPVRDALLRLQEQGLVEVLPRKGYRIKPISVADAAEMYEMRAVLERACIARAIDHAPDERLKALERFRKSGKTPDLPSWIAYNRAFHVAVVEAAGNARLARAARDIIEEFDRLTYMSIARFNISELSTLVAEHVELIDAMQRREKRGALAVARAHVDEARDRLLDSLSNLAVVP